MSEDGPQRLTAQAVHRPWPLPRRPWVMRMTWHDLLFMHWPIDADIMRGALARAMGQPDLPGQMSLDLYEGRAWLGVVPFGMRRVRGRCLAPLPGLSSFPELNVRTYVTCAGKPGVYFFSLDATSRLAVRAARWSFGLAYYDADIRLRRDRHGWIDFEHQRTHRDAPQARFRARYRGVSDAHRPAAGSLESFLTERYCLYTVDRGGGVWRGEIHHRPWTLQAGEAEVQQLDMTGQIGVALPHEPPRLYLAPGQMHVLAWLPRRCPGTDAIRPGR